jgi:hypothetical protein
MVWFRHTKRAGPAQRPAFLSQRVFFGPRIELKGCDRETPAKWASEWLHAPLRTILQTLPLAAIKRPPVESSPASTKTAELGRHGLLGELPPAVLLCRSQIVVLSPEASLASSSHCHCHRQRQRKKVVDDGRWSPNVGRLSRFSSTAARIHGSMMSASFSRGARNVWAPGPEKVVRPELSARVIVSHRVLSLSILADERPVPHRGEFSWSSVLHPRQPSRSRSQVTRPPPSQPKGLGG